MELFELVIGLLLVAAVLTTFAQRIGIPFPILLAISGTILALAPSDKLSARLDPDLALALFVAPVLVDAGYDTSLRDMRRNWKAIANLVVAAVGLTVAAVAVVAHWLVPDMPWPVAIALGAIVAPPDAVAATAVLRQLSPPYRMLVILEGESLLNDATALLIYRAALRALNGDLTSWGLVPMFLIGSVGGVVLGYGLARIYFPLMQKLADGPVNITMQFVGTFAVWILSDQIGISPILTVVVYAMTLGRLTPLKTRAEARMASFAVWDVAIYVLTALAFILMGLQLKEIGRNIDGLWTTYVAVSVAVLMVVIGARLVWVLAYFLYLRFVRRMAMEDQSLVMPTAKGAFSVGWCGMRGIVTLATALALPFSAGGHSFPYRDLLIAAAFTVVLGTLLIQGLTLGPILKRMQLTSDDVVAREEVFARQEISRAALAALDGEDRPEASILRKEYNYRLPEDLPAEEVLKPHHFGRLRLRAIEAERVALSRLRRDHKIGDAAFQTVQEELDWAEGHAARRKRAFSATAPDDTPSDSEPQV